jgi:hypothetical protein
VGKISSNLQLIVIFSIIRKKKFYREMNCCKKKNSVDTDNAQFFQMNGSWVSKETMKNNRPKKDEESHDTVKQHQNKHNPDENV